MAATKHSIIPSPLRLELHILGAKNVETKQKGSLFIRCYLPAGNNRTIQLNTRETIPYSKHDDHLFWDDNFSLECNGAEDSVRDLRDENIVFELRWRKAKHVLGKLGGSKLLASAEFPWKDVFDAPNMETQRWISMTVNSEDASGKLEEGLKPPALQIAMKVQVPMSTMSREEMRRRKRREEKRKWDDECRCSCACADTELLFVAASLEAF